MRSPLPIPLILVVLFAGAAVPARASTWELEARPLAAPVAIDGGLETEAWGSTPTLRFLSDAYRPMPGRARTRVWLRHDSDSLTLGWINDEPGVETAGLTPQGDSREILKESGAQARIQISGGAKGAERTFTFDVNPAGARCASRTGEGEWKPAWSAAATRGDGVWSAEMRIPFATLGWDSSKGRGRLGLSLTRRIRGRAHETQAWPWQPAEAEEPPSCDLKIAAEERTQSAPLPDAMRAFWTGWASRLDDRETSSSQLLAEQEPGRVSISRDLLLDALDRASQVDPLWGLSAGAAEPGMRETLDALEKRLASWLDDLASSSAAPAVPDRLLEARLPAPGGVGQATTILIFCGLPRGNDESQALVIDLHPEGASAQEEAERFLRWRRPRGESFILMIPESGGRLSGHAYDAEEEIWQAVDTIREMYSIDPDRVCLMGTSTGGSAALRMASRTPDRFAAVAAIGGGAPDSLLDNLTGVPTLLFNEAGEDSTAARFNLAWEARRKAIKAPGALKEIKKGPGDLFTRAVDDGFWRQFLSTPMTRQPTRVRFRPSMLRNNRAYWIQVDRFANFPPDAEVDFEARSGNRITGAAKGVTQLTFELSPPLFIADEDTTVTVNGRVHYHGPHRPRIQVEFAPPPTGEIVKSPARGGPLDDAFRGPALYIYGTIGGSDWTEASRDAAERAAARTGFRGRRVSIADANASGDQLASANLFVFGGPLQNRIAAQLKDQIPVLSDRKGIRVGDRLFGGPDDIAQFCWPSPFHPERYVVFHWANKPRALLQADWFPTPFRFQLLPDGVVDKIEMGAPGSRRRVAEWWFSEDWLTPTLRFAEGAH